MRPANDERIIIEYARVNRLVELALQFEDLEPFGEDFLTRLEDGVVLAGHWWKHEWRLGDIEPRKDSEEVVLQISGKFGWYDETATVDAPPPYDEQTHSWADETATAPQGVLALFIIDVASQTMAITSRAGDVSVPGFCNALTNLLNQAEMLASQRSQGRRAVREWLAEPIAERGTFETWVATMDRVVRVSAQFHRPNPRSNDDIEPVIEFLNGLKASSGSLAAKGEQLDPYGHPIMVAAIAMQENDYGSVNAEGIKENDERTFSSRDHPLQDRIKPDPQDPRLSLSGLLATMLRALANRVDRGLH
jgi:hypothetical protein